MFDLSKNHFELFGMPVRFLLDTAELSQRYRELQKVVHPDRYATAGEHSQRLSLQGATLVNEAFETLKDPLKRAQYLLVLNGVPMDPPQQALNDPAFLMQQMELREALSTVGAAPDSQAELDRLLDEIEVMITEHIAQLAEQLDNAGQMQLDAAVQTVQKMQFLNKLLAEAEAVEADLSEAG